MTFWGHLKDFPQESRQGIRGRNPPRLFSLWSWSLPGYLTLFFWPLISPRDYLYPPHKASPLTLVTLASFPTILVCKEFPCLGKRVLVSVESQALCPFLFRLQSLQDFDSGMAWASMRKAASAVLYTENPAAGYSENFPMAGSRTLPNLHCTQNWAAAALTVLPVQLIRVILCRHFCTLAWSLLWTRPVLSGQLQSLQRPFSDSVSSSAQTSLCDTFLVTHCQYTWKVNVQSWPTIHSLLFSWNWYFFTCHWNLISCYKLSVLFSCFFPFCALNSFLIYLPDSGPPISFYRNTASLLLINCSFLNSSPGLGHPCADGAPLCPFFLWQAPLLASLHQVSTALYLSHARWTRFEKHLVLRDPQAPKCLLSNSHIHSGPAWWGTAHLNWNSYRSSWGALDKILPTIYFGASLHFFNNHCQKHKQLIVEIVCFWLRQGVSAIFLPAWQYQHLND